MIFLTTFGLLTMQRYLGSHSWLTSLDGSHLSVFVTYPYDLHLSSTEFQEITQTI